MHELIFKNNFLKGTASLYFRGNLERFARVEMALLFILKFA
jgi:hypothetical protein